MKRANHLLPKILERENLRLAFHRAARGKRDRPDVREFCIDLETSLGELCEAVRSNTFVYGQAKNFVIYDPKKRTITAPVFSERVLHHAIMNICEPFFDRFLISNSFACRVGKGRIACLHRAMNFSRRQNYAVKIDMKSYFNSIDQEVLKNLLSRKFKDVKLIEVFGQIIDSHWASQCKGLPIGSLTSQHFANFYLGWFDHYVKNQLRVKGYVRYMDDCVIWADSRRELKRLATQCITYLSKKLMLDVNAPVHFKAASGIDFLGCRVFPSHMQLSRRSKRRYRKKMRELMEDLSQQRIGDQEFSDRATSLTAFGIAGRTKSLQFRQKTLQSFQVNGHGIEPGEPWRQLEQQRVELPISEP